MARGPVSEHVQVNFRLPMSLRDRIKASAERNEVSMTAEIIRALERVYPAPRTAQDVVDEVAAVLGYHDPQLLDPAIALLVKMAESGKLKDRAELERLLISLPPEDD